MQQPKVEIGYIVQDKESGLFLMPFDGDVGFTSWAHEAGHFEVFIDAQETAGLHCHEGFFVTTVCLGLPLVRITN